MGTVMSRLYRARQQVGGRLAAYARERGLQKETLQP
jgi:DNA-directed RNA polymerase specialized sigma24 family protein